MGMFHKHKIDLLSTFHEWTFLIVDFAKTDFFKRKKVLWVEIMKW